MVIDRVRGGRNKTRGGSMRPNKIKQMWRDGKCVTLGWLSVSHGFTAEVMARQGFDALCVDLQHGTAGDEGRRADAAGGLADRYGPGRAVAWNEPAAIMKALDLAPTPIIVPLVNAAAEAAMAVSACAIRRWACAPTARCAPCTTAATTAWQTPATDRRHGHDRDQGGLASLDAICARPASTRSISGQPTCRSLGLPPRGDSGPAPYRHVRQDPGGGAQAGIKCVMHCASAAFAAGAVKRGFDMVMLTSDLSCMIAGARAQLDELKAKRRPEALMVEPAPARFIAPEAIIGLCPSLTFIFLGRRAPGRSSARRWRRRGR